MAEVRAVAKEFGYVRTAKKMREGATWRRPNRTQKTDEPEETHDEQCPAPPAPEHPREHRRRKGHTQRCDCGCEATGSTQGLLPGADEPARGETPVGISALDAAPSSSTDEMDIYLNQMKQLLKDDEKSELEQAIEGFRMQLQQPVQVLELADPNLMEVDNDKYEEVVIEVALDSGAVDHVINHCDIPGYQVTPSRGSQRGLHFVAANGDLIHNCGEATLNLLPEETSVPLKSTFQIAAVSRPLYSASKIADQGCEITMDKHSAVVHKNGRTIAKFVRRKGLYLCKMTVRAPSKPKDESASVFARPP